MKSNNTTTDLNSSAVPYGERDERLAQIEIGVQAVIFVMAIFGNVCVLLVLIRRKKRLSRMNIFIMHLSIADVLVAVFNILPQMVWDITYTFMGGDFLCRTVKYLQVFVMFLSTNSIVVTAIDRYSAICHPFSHNTWTHFQAHVMVGCAYAISAMLSIPNFILFKLQETSVEGISDCWVNFYPKWTLHLYIWSFTLLVFFIPVIILCFVYISISITVWGKYRKTPSSGNYVSSEIIEMNGRMQSFTSTGNVNFRTHSTKNLSSTKIKTVKLTLVIIVAYLVCWTPFFVSQLWWLYDETAGRTNDAIVIMILLASLNSCCNPWIYMIFNRKLFCKTWKFRIKVPTSLRPHYGTNATNV